MLLAGVRRSMGWTRVLLAASPPVCPILDPKLRIERRLTVLHARSIIPIQRRRPGEKEKVGQPLWSVHTLVRQRRTKDRNQPCADSLTAECLVTNQKARGSIPDRRIFCTFALFALFALSNKLNDNNGHSILVMIVRGVTVVNVVVKDVSSDVRWRWRAVVHHPVVVGWRSSVSAGHGRRRLAPVVNLASAAGIELVVVIFVVSGDGGAAKYDAARQDAGEAGGRRRFSVRRRNVAQRRRIRNLRH